MATEQGRAAAFELPTQVFASASALIGAAAERSQALFASSLKTLEAEATRYLDELSTSNREALDALAHCEGPVDVLAAEQKWLAARTKACLDLSLRMTRALTDAASAASRRPQAPVLEVVRRAPLAEKVMETAATSEASALKAPETTYAVEPEVTVGEDADPILQAKERLRKTVDRLG
jgi:hypothetical protein